jgi:PD-(D/E)XK nuclease family transposase
MLTGLDNEVVFKKAFTDKIVFKGFVKDVLGIDVEVETIETEKQFTPRVGNIDFKLDIFAETVDKRIVIEIQRIEYDHNFDRFLHYFLALVIEQQKRSKEYGINQVVYAIIIMTEPFKLKDKQDRPIRDEVILMEINPKNILGEKIDLYGHQFVCLNPNHQDESTPQAIRDWLDLIYQSIHNPERPVINKNNPGILRASELIYYDNLDPSVVAQMKNSEATRTTTFKRERAEMEKAILKLHEKGVAIEIIMDTFEHTEEEIQTIIENQKLIRASLRNPNL